MTQVASKGVASSPELFHMDRVTCELGNRPSFRLRISYFTKGFPVSWVIMVLGNQPSFAPFFNFKSIKDALLGGDSSEKEKSLYRDLTGVVQEAEKQFIRVSLKRNCN